MADYQFMAIFKCPALPDVEFECTVGPLKIEITVAGRTFLVPQTVGHVAGSRSPVVPVAQSATLKLPVGRTRSPLLGHGFCRT